MLRIAFISAMDPGRINTGLPHKIFSGAHLAHKRPESKLAHWQLVFFACVLKSKTRLDNFAKRLSLTVVRRAS